MDESRVGGEKKEEKREKKKRWTVGGTASHCSNRSVAGQKGIY